MQGKIWLHLTFFCWFTKDKKLGTVVQNKHLKKKNLKPYTTWKMDATLRRSPQKMIGNNFFSLFALHSIDMWLAWIYGKQRGAPQQPHQPEVFANVFCNYLLTWNVYLEANAFRPYFFFFKWSFALYVAWFVRIFLLLHSHFFVRRIPSANARLLGWLNWCALLHDTLLPVFHQFLAIPCALGGSLEAPQKSVNNTLPKKKKDILWHFSQCGHFHWSF